MLFCNTDFGETTFPQWQSGLDHLHFEPGKETIAIPRLATCRNIFYSQEKPQNYRTGLTCSDY
jgi:hypothetical protein